jgi:Tfp pilus assembly protein PilN
MNYEINLIRRRSDLLKEKRVRHFLIYLFSLILIVSLLVVFSFYFANSYRIRAERREGQRLAKEVKTLGVSLDRIAEIKGKLQRAENNLSLIRKVSRERTFWAEKLAVLSRLMPPVGVIERIYSEGIGPSSQKIILEAHLPLKGSIERVGNFLAALNKDGALGKARLTSFTKKKGKGLAFFSLSLSRSNNG